jgi:hypothetical protein
MADIFISYKSEDYERASFVASALGEAGYSVWWDAELRTGETYDEVIDRELRIAHCVIVLWSQLSVKSRWVRAEATIGDRRGILLPVKIEDVDVPLQFELIHTADLIEWAGVSDDPKWLAFSRGVHKLVKPGEASSHEAIGSLGERLFKGVGRKCSGKSIDVELEFWRAIADSVDPYDFRAYVRRYPKGRFRRLAKKRIAQLEAVEATASVDETPRQAPGVADALTEKVELLRHQLIRFEREFGAFQKSWRKSVDKEPEVKHITVKKGESILFWPITFAFKIIWLVVFWFLVAIWTQNWLIESGNYGRFLQWLEQLREGLSSFIR